MPKVSQLPRDSSPATSDYVVGNQASGPTTQRFLLSDLITLFWTLANIPTGATSPITRDNESQFAFVASGGVWSGDSYGVNRNASMTALVCYINGRRISIAAVTARTFTASVDTYIDVLDNGDGTGTLVYTTAVNNAASPALAANSMRIGIIVAGVSTIAAAGSVNQGQPSMVLPIASSIAYSVTDSLGNLIYNRNPNPTTIGYRQITANATGTGAVAQVTGLSVPVIIPAGRKAKVRMVAQAVSDSTVNTVTASIWDGVVSSGTQIATGIENIGVATAKTSFIMEAPVQPSLTASSSKTYNVGCGTDSGTFTIFAASTGPAFVTVELE